MEVVHALGGEGAASSSSSGATGAAAGTGASAGATAAAGAPHGPDPFRTDLSVYHPYVVFEPLAAGMFTRIKHLADAIHGKVSKYRWNRELRQAPQTRALMELDEAIGIVERCIASNDPTDLVQFAQGLCEGGGHLRGILRMHHWGGGAFAEAPDLQSFLEDLTRARQHLVGQLQDEIVVGKRMASHLVRQNEGRQTCEGTAYFHPRGPPPAPHIEDAMNEIGVLSYLRRLPNLPVYLLRLLGVFLEGDYVTMVTEFADSELFAQVASGLMTFPEERVMRYTWQLLQATRFLHSHYLGHRDISLENILISFGSDPRGEIRLMDFGQAVRTHSRCRSVLLRYFVTCGKHYYRAPECYVPRQPRVGVLAPVDFLPGDVAMAQVLDANMQPTGYFCEVRLPSGAKPGLPCAAATYGYTVPPADVFACGVALFILTWKAPPWKMALLSDPGFLYVKSNGDGAIGRLVRNWRKEELAPPAMALLTSMVQAEPRRRPSVEDCLASPWFDPMAAEQVPTHPPPTDPLVEEGGDPTFSRSVQAS